MGQVTAKVKIANQGDVELSERGQIPSEEVRQIEVEGVIDTGATSLSLPTSMIKKLGLRQVDKRKIKTANGSVVRRVYSPALITILGRSSVFRVVELPEDVPPLIGTIVLEELDLVPNPTAEQLEPNPKHGGEWISYAY